jgi:hypothetical protein
MTEQERIFNSLKNEGPEAWLAYLRPFEEGEPIEGSGLSMLVIFHYVAPLAKKQLSLDWAEVAVRAVELKAAQERGAIEREGNRLWAMQLRSWFISQMGSRSHHLVLDKQIILDWVLEGVNFTVQSAKERAASLWENFARAEKSSNHADLQRVTADLSELRSLKHRFNVVKVLADCGELPSDSPLYKWLEIREQLP